MTVAQTGSRRRFSSFLPPPAETRLTHDPGPPDRTPFFLSGLPLQPAIAYPGKPSASNGLQINFDPHPMPLPVPLNPRHFSQSDQAMHRYVVMLDSQSGSRIGPAFSFGTNLGKGFSRK